MGKRGQYKYICEDCHAENWLSAKERQSSFRPKCIECGSTWLEPSKGSHCPDKIDFAKTAAKDIISLQKQKMGKK